MAKFAGWDDTIVALSTPPGIGAIAVIRLSGSEAFAIIDRLFPSKDIALQASHTLHVGALKKDGQMIDEVVVSLFKGPKSYTGEDIIEIGCHGSPFIQGQIINACIHEGARLAKPGEFTQRAFLHGKMDLAQAEAVADLIASNTEAARNTALHAMRGGFSEALFQLREKMIRFSALIELELDFSQEDVEFADRTEFYTLVREARQMTRRLLDSFKYGNVIKNGVRVAIVGKPNAGKSTLLNNLLNENRAIVSDIAGTTRDTIEEILNIEGILFRLTDTAGLRDHTADIIEQFGISKTIEKISQADIVLYVFDSSVDALNELQQFLGTLPEAQPVLLIANKVDIVGLSSAKEKFNTFRDIVFISAKNDAHLDALKKSLFTIAVSGAVKEGDTVVTNARHYDALKSLSSALDDVHTGLDAKIPGDLLSLDIRRCLHYLGEITGEITNEEQLDWIFSKFCIGK